MENRTNRGRQGRGSQNVCFYITPPQNQGQGTLSDLGPLPTVAKKSALR